MSQGPQSVLEATKNLIPFFACPRVRQVQVLVVHFPVDGPVAVFARQLVRDGPDPGEGGVGVREGGVLRGGHGGERDQVAALGD